jgi:nicotinamidase/pyrazinamidase
MSISEVGSERRALVVVDVQPTFCEGGEIATEGAKEIAHRVAAYAAAHRDRYATVLTTQDWHIDPGEHFSDTPDFVDSWPPHGIAGTPNAELHPALADLEPGVRLQKGQYSHGYSGFEGADEQGRTLATVLSEAGITAVDVVGLVESHCVKHTALDARRAGLSARVLTDLTIPVSEAQGEVAEQELTAAGVELRDSAAV